MFDGLTISQVIGSFVAGFALTFGVSWVVIDTVKEKRNRRKN